MAASRSALCGVFTLSPRRCAGRDVNGTQWVVSPSGIAKHYAKSFWFPLDLFSVLTSIFDLVNIEGGSSLIILKVLRTLRLLKLVKLARGSRVFKRWEMRLSINYQALSLFTILIVIILTCHWTACLWGIAAGFDPLKSWAGPHMTAYCVPWEGTEPLGADASSPENAYPCPYELEDTRDGRLHVYTECTERKCKDGRDGTDSCTDGFACVDGFSMCTRPCASNPHAALPHAPATSRCPYPTPPFARGRHLRIVLCDHDHHERGLWRRHRLGIQRRRADLLRRDHVFDGAALGLPCGRVLHSRCGRAQRAGVSRRAVSAQLLYVGSQLAQRVAVPAARV